MHMHAQARSQLKQRGLVFPPDSPMGLCGSNSSVRWDRQKCISRQHGTAGQSDPEMEGAGKLARGAAHHDWHQQPGCSGRDADKAVGKKSREKTLIYGLR